MPKLVRSDSRDKEKSREDLPEALYHLVRQITCLIETIKNDNNQSVLKRIDTLERTLMASNAAVAKQLSDAIERVAKIGEETRKLLKLIEELKAAGGINAEASPEVKAKADELDVQLGIVDEFVTDETPPPQS